MFIQLTKNPINPNHALEAVRDPSCGAVASFEGNIRAENEGQKVLRLEYEVYDKLFYAEVERICSEIKRRWAIHEISLIQRVGKLEVGETGIFIAVSSPHRREALEACAYAIEEFKKRAPVWKKEYTDSEARWVAC